MQKIRADSVAVNDERVRRRNGFGRQSVRETGN